MASLNKYAERLAYALNDPLNMMLRANLKFSIIYWRATLIRRDVQQNGLSDEFLQRFFFDLIKVDKVDNCNYTIGCDYILRSKYVIPKPVRLKTDVTFKFVGVLDQKDNFKAATYVEFEEFRYTEHNKYTPKVIRYNWTNGYFYFFTNTLLKRGIAQAILVDPSSVASLCDEVCYTDDSEFPLAEDMFQAIVQGILKGEFPIMNPQDTEVTIEK